MNQTFFFATEAEAGPSTGRLPLRTEIAPKHQWNVSAMFASNEEWEADFARIDMLLEPLLCLRGTLNSPSALATLFEHETALDRLLEKLYVYAHLRADENTADAENQARMDRVRSRYAKIGGQLAWITPEILANPMEVLEQWRDSSELAPVRYAMVKLLRQKPHTLSAQEETLLSKAADLFQAPQQAFNLLTNADLRFPEIEDASGEKVEFSQGRYRSFLMSPDRRVRKDAFEAMHETYGSVRNTLACTLSANVRYHNYKAEVRHFGSALEAALHPDNVPVSLYEALIDAVHRALPGFHKYIELRKTILKVDSLDMYDLYVPLVPEIDIKVPFEQAKTWVIDACAPLGEEYVTILKSAFEERWIDIYENRGKRSGAYSSGCFDSLPYILLNYNETLDDVFTLAHELGHSMHSWLANQAQPHRFASYPIFIAEIPSTLNEALLLDHLLKQNPSPEFRAYLLNHLADSFKGTVFRQTQFAEFERMIHDAADSGQPLTHELLCDRYYELNSKYYGPAVDADRRIGLEWARIPHFYYNFYVYKYATSFCASQIFAGWILDGERDADAYLDLLRAGGSGDPIELIARAGVNMLDPEVLGNAFRRFDQTVAAVAEGKG
ncbi:MAG: oligoendopeptidase F [Verrucomicrobiota bacterium]